jgi:hypothetical protein
MGKIIPAVIFCSPALDVLTNYESNLILKLVARVKLSRSDKFDRLTGPVFLVLSVVVTLVVSVFVVQKQVGLVSRAANHGAYVDGVYYAAQPSNLVSHPVDQDGHICTMAPYIESGAPVMNNCSTWQWDDAVGMTTTITVTPELYNLWAGQPYKIVGGNVSKMHVHFPVPGDTKEFDDHPTEFRLSATTYEIWVDVIDIHRPVTLSFVKGTAQDVAPVAPNLSGLTLYSYGGSGVVQVKLTEAVMKGGREIKQTLFEGTLAGDKKMFINLTDTVARFGFWVRVNCWYVADGKEHSYDFWLYNPRPVKN